MLFPLLFSYFVRQNTKKGGKKKKGLIRNLVKEDQPTKMRIIL
jgi:hypothetical protein